MYIEFLFLIIDYFSTIDRRIFIYEWLIPIAIGIVSLFFSISTEVVDLYGFTNGVIGFISVLLGFTLAALTLFLTGNTHIERTKQYITDKTIRGKKISLHRLLVVNYSYLIVIESILCICFYIGNLFSFLCSTTLALGLNSIFIILFFNILLTTIRTITDLYFIISKE